MRKKSTKRVTTKSAHDDYELPEEVDFRKTRFIGFGLDALDRHDARTRMPTIALDPDVAQFRTAEEVNEALRLVQKMRAIGKSAKRRKSALSTESIGVMVSGHGSSGKNQER